MLHLVVLVLAEQLELEFQQKMMEAVQAEGLEVQRFNEINAAQQQSGGTDNISKDELDKFNSANEKIVGIQKEVGATLEKAIAEEGMEPATFQQIMIAYQQDESLRTRIDAMMQSGQ